MKRESTSSLFGITQQEMAIVLGIGVTHWAMFECGQRSIPLPVLHKLNEMHRHVKHPETIARVEKAAAQGLGTGQKHLRLLLAENQHRQYFLAVQIADLEKKHEAHLRLRGLIDYLEKDKGEKHDYQISLFKDLEHKVLRFELADHFGKLEMYRHELEMLVLHNTVLKEKLETSKNDE